MNYRVFCQDSRACLRRVNMGVFTACPSRFCESDPERESMDVSAMEARWRDVDAMILIIEWGRGPIEYSL